tara:strand:- start:3379 stop:3912 length:534 start_codon:yes stop_codon:yes gene_type:complete
MGFERMKSRFLDASSKLIHSHDEQDTSIYTLELRFVDLFSRERKHVATIELPKSQEPKTMVSFTAMSSIDMRVGVVQRVTDLKVFVLTVGGVVETDNRHDHSFKMGDPVYLIEHLDPADESGKICHIPLHSPLPFDTNSLCLQSVNADVLDDSGKILHRLSADPLYIGVSSDTRVAT